MSGFSPFFNDFSIYLHSFSVFSFAFLRLYSAFASHQKHRRWSVFVMDSRRLDFSIKEVSAYAHYSVLRSICALTFLYSYTFILLHTLSFVLHFKYRRTLCFIIFFSRLLYYIFGKTVKFNEKLLKLMYFFLLANLLINLRYNDRNIKDCIIILLKS